MKKFEFTFYDSHFDSLKELQKGLSEYLERDVELKETVPFLMVITRRWLKEQKNKQ